MSWPTEKLGNIAEVVTGSTPSKKNAEFYGGNIPFITPSELNDNEISDSKVSLSKSGAKVARILPADSVLVCCIGSLGKIGFTRKAVATNQQINSLIFDQDKVFPRYGYHCCKILKPILKHIAPSTTIAIVNKSRFSELKIPLPPLKEQKRIAAILDKADAIRRKRQQAIDLTDQLLRSVFLDMFGDPVTNPKGYKVGKIEDLLSSVNYGTSAKAGEEGEFPILRMNNITYEGDWNFKKLKYLDMDEKERKKYTAESGDILFNRTNSKELVGKTAVFREEKPFIFAGYLVRSKVNFLAEPDYISSFLNSKYGKTILQHMCKSIVGMANINAKEYQSIKILIPPIDEQKKYASIVKKYKRGLVEYKKFLKISENLFNSLTKKAFNGELSKQT